MIRTLLQTCLYISVKLHDTGDVYGITYQWDSCWVSCEALMQLDVLNSELASYHLYYQYQ